MGTKKRLFIDMDGTLAEYRTFKAMEQYYQKGYFESLKPLQNVVDAVKIIIEKCPDIKVYTLSACPEGPQAPQEKNLWLDINLPEITLDNRIYTIVGESKRDYIPGGIDENDYLLDDYPHNLHDWAHDGIGIKLFNGLNANLEKWPGSCISYKNSPEYIAQALIDIITKDKVIVDEMDEIQIKNEDRGQSLFIDRDELSQIIDKYFNKDFTDIDDFRRNYAPSDWDFIKRISSTARVEIHTSSKQYGFEYDTLKKKIDNSLSIVVESLSNQRKDLVEKEIQLELSQKDMVNNLNYILSLKESFNVWNDYFGKTIEDLEQMTQNFFARYEAASKGNDFSNISLHSDADSLFNKINNVREVCARIYNQDKKHLNVLYNEIKNHHSSKSNQQHITSNQSKSISDSVLDEEVSSPNFFTQSADDILDLS